jgi:integrase
LGSLYRRGDSKFIWIAYYKDGKQFLESTRSESEDFAKHLLKLREGEIAQGKQPAVLYDRIKIDELLEDLLTDYRINKRKSFRTLKGNVALLKKEFGGFKASRIDTARIRTFIDKRMKEGVAHATINRSLAALKRAYILALRCTPPKVAAVPYIPMLKENNTRKGFFERDEYLKLKAALPFYLRPMLTFGYMYGWRRGEIRNLTWDKVDLNQGVVRLDPGETKNDQAREVYLNEECLRDFAFLYATRGNCKYVFHWKGRKIGAFRKTWASAYRKIGLEERLFHDLRRTAVRNLIRSGVQERVAMQITGHRTRAVFDRYNIVSSDDLRKATEKRNNYEILYVGQERVAGEAEKVSASA